MSLLVNGYFGLGDNIYQRPIIKALVRDRGAPIFLKTPWPEMFWDMEPEVTFVHPGDIRLRTQMENANRFPPEFWAQPGGMKSIRPNYSIPHFKRGLTPIQAFEETSGVKLVGVDEFHLPVNPEWVDAAAEVSKDWPERFALVRPPTVRREWRNESRNPDPDVFRCACESVQARDIALVGFGYLCDNEEWMVPDMDLELDYEYMGGELAVTTIAALMGMATITVASPCFVLPLSCAVQAKALIVFGGCNMPELLFDSRMEPHYTRWVAPDPFCNCLQHTHSCFRDIEAADIDLSVQWAVGGL